MFYRQAGIHHTTYRGDRALFPDSSQTLDTVRSLAASGAIRISNHGYDELAEDDIMAALNQIEEASK